MALMDFIKKQVIDIVEWTQPDDGTLAWRFPMQDREIQNGGSLMVRESRLVVVVNEGKLANMFGSGRHTLTSATLPVPAYLNHRVFGVDSFHTVCRPVAVPRTLS